MSRQHRNRLRLLYVLLGTALFIALLGSIALFLLRDVFATFTYSNF